MYEAIQNLQKFDALNGKTLFICVGAMKSATSWVHSYLSTLDGVTPSPLKEVHFFNMKFAGHALGDMDMLALKRLKFHIEQSGDPAINLQGRETFQASVDRAQMIYDDNAYFAHFARICETDTKVLCDITPAYSVLGPAGFDYLKSFCATQDIRLKLLFIMRDPIDRMWSQMRHMTQTNPDSDLVINWAKGFASPSICARADYRGVVGDLDRIFAPDDLLYLFYEDLFTESSLRALADHIGADYRPADTKTRHNETKIVTDMPAAAFSAAKELLAPQYAFCTSRFGDRVPANWQV